MKLFFGLALLLFLISSITYIITYKDRKKNDDIDLNKNKLGRIRDNLK
jgi:hypothetical protein